MMHCATAAHENREAARFCDACGQQLIPDTAGAGATIPAPMTERMAGDAGVTAPQQLARVMMMLVGTLKLKMSDQTVTLDQADGQAFSGARKSALSAQYFTKRELEVLEKLTVASNNGRAQTALTAYKAIIDALPSEETVIEPVTPGAQVGQIAELTAAV